MFQQFRDGQPDDGGDGGPPRVDTGKSTANNSDRVNTDDIQKTLERGDLTAVKEMRDKAFQQLFD